MLVGIYNSAILVSASNDLRKSIYKHALESKLLGLIGSAAERPTNHTPARAIRRMIAIVFVFVIVCFLFK